MNETTLVALVGIFAACFGSNGFWQWLITKRKRNSPSDNMLLALGRYRLNHLCKRYLRLGEIPDDEYEVFRGEYDAYIAMQGNSRVKKWCEEALKLPIIYEG